MRFVLLAGAAVASGLRLEFDAEEAKNRPVTKVVNLLKDMVKQLEHEGEQDKEIFEKMECWCKTNSKEKEEAIANAGDRTKQLQAAIEEGTAKAAQLDAEIENLEKEVAKHTEALNQATALRQKESEEYNAKQKDILQAISSLKAAIVVLKKAQGGSLLQADAKAGVERAQFVMEHLFKKFGDSLLIDVTHTKKDKVLVFLQNAGTANPYASQSGEIFGILQNMLDTMIADNKEAMDTEAASAKAYEDLKAAKTELIKSSQEQMDTKTDQVAATREQVETDKEDLGDTGKKLAADQEFLTMLKEKCSQTDDEFAARQKSRAEEIEATQAALKFLNSDEAHDLFSNTFNKSFLQVQDSRRAAASAFLTKSAMKLNAPALSVLATQVKLDAFTKVKKAIDDMVAGLTKQKADEIKHRDFCIKGLNENETQTTAAERKKSDLEAHVGALEKKIEELKDEIKSLKEANEETKKNLKVAGEDREKENAEFQQVVQDQRATVALLTKAMEVLKGVFEKSGNAFLATGQPAGPPPPAGFKAYKQNSGGSSVITMITQIINDAKAMEAEAVRDESEAQKTYEAIVKEGNNTLKANRASIVNKENASAKAEGEKVQAEQDLDDTEVELTGLANAKADLKQQCDFTIKNFDIRQEAFSQEIEALRQAKAILSGAK